MRKLFVLLLAMVALGGMALAQGDDAAATVTVDDVVTENYWGGVSFGYPGINGHFGVKDVFGPGIDIRANLGFNYIVSGFALGADALIDINLNVDAPLSLYAGGGPIVFFGDDFEAGLELLAGLEYRLSDLDFDSGAVFFEVGPAFGTFGFDFIGRVGFNYYF